jgi:hypothetical protein
MMPGFKGRTTAMGLTNPVYNNPAYVQWLSSLKLKVHAARIKAAVTVNRELLLFYWELGAEIVCKQAQSNWGDGFLSQLSKDMMAEFPDMKGFSKRNLELIRKWHLFYAQSGGTVAIAKQAVSQLSDVYPQIQASEEIVTHIPWGHNIAIVTKCKNRDEAYAILAGKPQIQPAEYRGD